MTLLYFLRITINYKSAIYIKTLSLDKLISRSLLDKNKATSNPNI